MGNPPDNERCETLEECVCRQLAEIDVIYDTVPVGLCVFDKQGRYVRVDERLAEINGLPEADHIGRTIREVVLDLADQAEEILLRVMEKCEPVRDVEVTGTTAKPPRNSIALLRRPLRTRWDIPRPCRWTSHSKIQRRPRYCRLLTTGRACRRDRSEGQEWACRSCGIGRVWSGGKLLIELPPSGGTRLTCRLPREKDQG